MIPAGLQLELLGMSLVDTEVKSPVDKPALTKAGEGVMLEQPGGHEARDGDRSESWNQLFLLQSGFHG